MGEGAALQFYLDNQSWIDSPEQAYEILYPQRKVDRSKSQKTRCPRCKRRFKSGVGVLQHMRDVHRDNKGVTAAREFAETHKIKKIPPHVKCWLSEGDKHFALPEPEVNR
ncbi:hypothetical protein [Ruegeria lacuscaerulensis]|uniref:hypothetical protein n=1 Tax=Ruegeria lacuscaerulensis TaxID=55218 RepID=UPI0014809D6C|nr:hypothetical protein [Ruegeria lacuscaerulensis]